MPDTDPLARTRSLCRSWLRWDDPTRRPEVPVKIAVYDSAAGGGGGEKLGAYLGVLRQAQFHWAAMQLPDFHRRCAFARRQHRDDRDVMAELWRHHEDEWKAWRQEKPIRPLRRLIHDCADQMALRIGEIPL